MINLEHFVLVKITVRFFSVGKDVAKALGYKNTRDALAQLTQEQRLIYEEEESKRGKRRMPPRPVKMQVSPKNRYKFVKEEERYAIAVEAWEIKCLDLDIDANKTRLKRICQKLGTNPRKKSK